MIEVNRIYKLLAHLKGWSVDDATNIAEASHLILGSPYWDIPKDMYRIIDKNDTYSLLAVYKDGRTISNNHYLAVNIHLEEKIQPIPLAEN